MIVVNAEKKRRKADRLSRNVATLLPSTALTTDQIPRTEKEGGNDLTLNNYLKNKTNDDILSEEKENR
jgi:hypothetical protein